MSHNTYDKQTYISRRAWRPVLQKSQPRRGLHVENNFFGNRGIPKPIKQYQENRAKFTIDELKPYTGKWAAFRADGAQIIASAESLTTLVAEVEKEGFDPQDVVFERIELDADNDSSEVFLGAAELLSLFSALVSR